MFLFYTQNKNGLFLFCRQNKNRKSIVLRIVYAFYRNANRASLQDKKKSSAVFYSQTSSDVEKQGHSLILSQGSIMPL